MKIHSLITTTDALAALCERLAKSDFVTVDTEFMRENTYWPELCLVQIGNLEEAAAIDPKAPGLDLGPLRLESELAAGEPVRPRVQYSVIQHLLRGCDPIIAPVDGHRPRRLSQHCYGIGCSIQSFKQN